MTQPGQRGPLNELRVLDLTTELGTLAGRFLTGLGASVKRLVPPGGDPLRTKPPFAPGKDGGPVSLYGLHLLRGRIDMKVDLESESGQNMFVDLVGASDVILESQPVGHLAARGIDYRDLASLAPHAIWTSVTPFGREGPKATWGATDLIGMAAGGLMSLCGDPDRAPLRLSVEQGYALSGVQATVGTLAAIHARHTTGKGQLVDVSMQEAVANCLGNARLFYEFEGLVSRRAGGSRAYGDHGSRLVYECSDGYVALSRLPSSIQLLHDWVVENGEVADFDPEEWATFPQSGPGSPGPEKARELEGTLERFFLQYPKMWLYEDGQKRGVLICPVSTPEDLLANEQLVDRGFFRGEFVSELGFEVQLPGPPFRSTLGPSATVPPQAQTPAGAAKIESSREILEDIRVADFSWVGVGPLSTQQLAWLGADVIRVESTERLDVFRSGGPKRGEDPDASAYFANCNRDKRGITMNLKSPAGQEAARRLAARSDVLVESFTPGFMTSVGLDYDSLKAINPSLIMLSASMEGQSGPHSQFRGFGLTLQATVGFTHYTGWPGRAPTGTGVAYTDWFATGVAATALLAALEHRRKTGQGQNIDLSQLEACTWALDTEIVSYTVNGSIGRARGNRHREMVPHGAFACAGEDQWVALVIRNDGEWASLAALLTAGGVTVPDCPDQDTRRELESPIEELVGEWCSQRDKHEAAAALRKAGIPAHAVADVSDVHNDEQLRARGHFWRVAHPEIGEVDWDGPAYHLSATPLAPERPAPKLGEHNHEVYAELLGYSEDELADMIATGALD